MIYRGYEIKACEGGFMWTDERNFDHFAELVMRVPYKTKDDAMNGIDQYKRNMRSAQG